MCRLSYFQHKTCKHIWAVVMVPCGPWKGFSNCDTIGDGREKETPRFYKSLLRPCPLCDLQGMYDRNTMRVIEAMGWGVTVGLESGGDWGMDFRLGSTKGMCVML